MKKTICLLIAILLFVIITGCGGNADAETGSSDAPNTEKSLEFQICENVDDVDFSKYVQRYGLVGGREYYGTGYYPTMDENGQQIDPEKCVIYTVTSYPDYADNTRCITGITITDPDVTVYGLSIDSPEETIKSVMKSNGFELVDTGSQYSVSFGKDDVTFVFSEGRISIIAKVTNKNNIVF